MTLLSILVVLLFSSLRTGAESWNAGESKIAQVNEKAVVYQFFKRYLTALRPVWDDYSDHERKYSFQGTRNSIQFVSVFPASSVRKGLQLFTVAKDNAHDDVITVTVKPFYPTEGDEEEKTDEIVLLEQVEDFDLSYFEPTEGGGGNWVDVWLDRETLPALIGIKITLKDQSFWPEMIFKLRNQGKAEDAEAQHIPDEELLQDGP